MEMITVERVGVTKLVFQFQLLTLFRQRVNYIIMLFALHCFYLVYFVALAVYVFFSFILLLLLLLFSVLVKSGIGYNNRRHFAIKMYGTKCNKQTESTTGL